VNICGIIPARMASSRFPGKPLARIKDIPMIGHVYLRCKMAATLDDLWVATCDAEIVDYIQSIGGKAIMTADSHERASERVAEALVTIEQNTGKKADIVVMIQGDEPLVRPEMIDEALEPLLKDNKVRITNLMQTITTTDEFEDPNEVKVVVDRFNDALYFSREPIPSRKKGVGDVPMFKQVCIIPFRRDFLLEYVKMSPTPLEKIESVDMMRILENGMKVRMVLNSSQTKSVDTETDLAAVERLIESDPLLKVYRKSTQPHV